MSQNKFLYSTSCVHADAASVLAMVDRGREITLQTFRRRVDCRQWEKEMGYSRQYPMEREHYVSFYRSQFRGRPCYYAVHSAIEYIFTPSDTL